jgi:hypothetical protein
MLWLISEPFLSNHIFNLVKISQKLIWIFFVGLGVFFISFFGAKRFFLKFPLIFLPFFYLISIKSLPWPTCWPLVPHFRHKRTWLDQTELALSNPTKPVSAPRPLLSLLARAPVIESLPPHHPRFRPPRWSEPPRWGASGRSCNGTPAYPQNPLDCFLAPSTSSPPAFRVSTMGDLELLLDMPSFPVMLSSLGVVVHLPACSWRLPLASYHRGHASTASPCHGGTS